jgi:hypothetical protein
MSTFLIREATLNDLESLVALEDHLRALPSTIRDRILLFQEGPFVIEIGGEVCGVLYSQRVRNIDALIGSNYQRQYELHHTKGQFWQVLCFNVDYRRITGGKVPLLGQPNTVENTSIDDPTIFFHLQGNFINSYKSSTKHILITQGVLAFYVWYRNTV